MAALTEGPKGSRDRHVGTLRASASDLGRCTEVSNLLELDPDLAPGVPDSELAAAGLASRAAVFHIAEGRWEPVLPAPDGMGYLLLSGMVARMVRVGRRESLELLGEGDVLHPSQEDGPSLLGCDVRWEVLARASAADLSSRWCRAMRPWPQVIAAVAGRGLRRARSHAVRDAITAHPTVQERLLLMLMHIAERTGRVCPEGIVFDLPLSHRLLADLVQATRPSVTNALLRLRDRGLVVQRRRRQWLVTQAGIDAMSELCGRA